MQISDILETVDSTDVNQILTGTPTTKNTEGRETALEAIWKTTKNSQKHRSSYPPFGIILVMNDGF